MSNPERPRRLPSLPPLPPPLRTWLLLPAVFLLSRLISIAALYLIATPTGRLVAEDPWNLGRVTLLSELGSFLVVSGLLGFVMWKASERTRRVIWYVALSALLTYALLAEADVHLRRWMGLRLNLVFVRHFFLAAGESGFWSMLELYVAQDLRSVILSVLLIVVPVTAALLFRPRPVRRGSRRLHAGLVVVGALALAWSAHLGIAVRKWRMVAPIPYALVMDVARELGGASKPPSVDDIAALQELLGARTSDGRYPMWHRATDEQRSLDSFARRPAGQQPDVFVFAVESLRGWVADWRSPAIAERLPHLSALFRERGVAFVRSHSNGYPSGEGNANLNLGVWSHPSRALPAEHVAIRSRSLVQILKRAGYQNVWLTGSDPSFDNLQHFVGRWYDRWELHKGGDMELARGLIKAYDAMGAASDAPRFLSVYTYSTHPFYQLPDAEGPAPEDSEQAYLRALKYADRAVGMVIDHVRRAGRMDRTIFVVTGDHSQPTPWHLANDDELGPANAGRTWTGLLIAGKGLPGGTVREDASSHVDVPPTLLGMLGIDASHHFLGRDLFRQPEPRPVVSVFRESASLILGDTMLVGDLDGESLRKFRYDEGPLEDPLAYKHGSSRPVEPADLQRFARVRRAVKAYAWLLDHDYLEPPRPADADRGGPLSRR